MRVGSWHAPCPGNPIGLLAEWPLSPGPHHPSVDGKQAYRDSDGTQIGKPYSSGTRLWLRPIASRARPSAQPFTRITGSASTEPISQQSSPRRRKASVTDGARSGATEKSSPPEVSDSVSSDARYPGTDGAIVRSAPNDEST